MGTPDANGAGANSVGFVKFIVVGIPGGVDDADVLIKYQSTDVRCKGAVATCGNANAQDGPDYTGEVQGNVGIRITDHNNAPTAAGPFTDTATVLDLPLPVNTTCTNTASTTEGATCSLATSVRAVVPAGPAVSEGKRANVELSQLTIFDGGPDGSVATADNSAFARQGIFIP